MTSLQIQKATGAKVTEKMLEHELFRFCNMDVDALQTRIEKIKNPIKLEAFRQTAKMVGERKLVKMARTRRNTLYN